MAKSYFRVPHLFSKKPPKQIVQQTQADKMPKGEASGKQPDKGGLGSEPLYEPKDEKADVDIVFVHGINGDRIKTWTYEDRDFPENNKLWPKAFLPEKLPNARIVSFGYNAKFAAFFLEDQKIIAPEYTVDDFSTSLLEALRGLRKAGETDRPIIFVAHSMGGLVVANALSRSHESDKGLQSIADHTIGALFLGTPFHGSELATYGSLGVSLLKYVVRTQGDSLDTLTKKSKKLADINASFAEFLRNRDRARDKPLLEIACFFEGIPVTGKTLVVPKESATWLGVKPLSIDANHMNMCRFDSDAREGYTRVSDKLKQWIDDYDEKKHAGGVGGLKPEDIGIHVSGDINLQNARFTKSQVMGHQVATKENAINNKMQWIEGAGSENMAGFWESDEPKKG